MNRPISHLTLWLTLLIATLLAVPMLAVPVAVSAAEGDTAAGAGAGDSASAAISGMGALYETKRSEAGNLPGDELLGLQLPADTVVLTMEMGDQRFHALRQEADSADPLGWILLLPDPGIGSAWPEQTEALRFDLAQQGWLTLVLEPPQPSKPVLPERTLPVMKSFQAASAATDAAAETSPAGDSGSAATRENSDTVAPPAPFSERFNERLTLALEQLPKEEGQIRIVLAIGRAANWSSAYLAAHPELEANLILLDPLADSDPETPSLSDLWSSLISTPVLDLYHSPLPGYPQAAPDARIRRSQALRAKMEQYHQARISPPFTGWQREMPWLTQTIRGMIKSRIIEPHNQAREMEKYAAPTPQQMPPGAATRR